MPTPSAEFPLQSLYRMLDAQQAEGLAVRGQLRKMTRDWPVFRRLCEIPGLGPVLAHTLWAWMVDPCRFHSRRALSAYAGLGLKQNVTNWSPTHRARASQRGQRQVQRALLLAARAILRCDHSSLAQRDRARREKGWIDSKAIRDLARTRLFVIVHVWKTGESYDDARITVPAVRRAS